MTSSLSLAMMSHLVTNNVMCLDSAHERKCDFPLDRGMATIDSAAVARDGKRTAEVAAPEAASALVETCIPS